GYVWGLAVVATKNASAAKELPNVRVVTLLFMLLAAVPVRAEWTSHIVTDPPRRGKIGIGASVASQIESGVTELTVNCSDRSTTVFITSWLLPAGDDDIRVEYTIDGLEPAYREVWQRCKTKDCVGLWNDLGRPFAESLLNRSHLKFVMKLSAGELTAIFRIEDSARNLRQVGVDCGWPVIPNFRRVPFQ